MHNILDVAHTLVRHIQTHYPDDIAIVAYYGSYAQGTATQRSDLDFFFISATSRGYDASLQFVLNDISFDFWPISWERAARMAAFEETNTSIIADCKLLYVRSEEDRVRFLQLRDTIAEMPNHGLKLVERAESHMRDIYAHVYNMTYNQHRDDMTLYRVDAHAVITKVLESLALLNRTYFTKGWGKNAEQYKNFAIRPARLEEAIDTIIHAQNCVEIRVACEGLVHDTLELLIEQKNTYSNGPSYPDRMRGFYEELKGIFDKLLTACEKKDYASAFFWSIGIQDELARFLYYSEKGHWPLTVEPNIVYQNHYFEAGLPNLITLLNPDDYEPLQVAVEDLQCKLECHLRTRGVDIHRFSSIPDLEEFLTNRIPN
ncbi:hypothetical protein BVG16_21480 [Paenibacillus selenitireducens]|uniref:Polymerase nucleotidyl transferase domain-containing protein n=1 Tax=Paenibacillus selenitireducens TaxID=1324314 RepID=A0A1T2X5M8_9BACL|nr:nucleotidyltransferase domain-containing protein [Paenibacillus selenitireducens]OPA75179.1 hypothetical protein BVG16_21480 [Paenibacillus selenitireducens]